MVTCPTELHASLGRPRDTSLFWPHMSSYTALTLPSVGGVGGVGSGRPRTGGTPITKREPAVPKPEGAVGKEERSSTTRSTRRKAAATPVLLAGGNPQIAKADGDAPVQDYIAAMPGWKRDVGRRLDALIVATVPNVIKAVKWNSPLYGIEGQGWFLSFHCFTKHVKVTFFRGTSLRPLPPGESKNKDPRYLDIHEDDEIDQEQVASWIRQASELPGWVP